MTSATEQLTKVEDQIIETLATLQKPVVEVVRTLTEKAEGYVPEGTRTEVLPPLDELIVSQFAFAERMLANQKAFVNALLDAIKPLSSRVTAQPPSKTKARTRTTKTDKADRTEVA